MTPPAFGIQVSGPLVGPTPDRGHFRDVAVAAEAAGFDSLWAGDHVSFHHPLLDVTVALASFAAVTERIGLGAGVLLLPLRAPALVAREVASLDFLSGGRVILGVGVGGESPKDFEAVGAPLAQPGGPPLWVGGRSDAAIERAATLGDGWLPLWVSPERLAAGIGQVRAHAGDRRITAAVVLPALVGGTVEEARRYLSRRYATDFSTHATERYCLVGPADRCAERAREYVAAGAEHLVFNPAVEPAWLGAQLERLAEVAGAAAR